MKTRSNCTFNGSVPNNLWLIAGDPALEIQAQVINQISGQTLPSDAWKNVHLWLKDLLDACATRLGQQTSKFFIDCNPSFSAYTELAMMASERLITRRTVQNVSAVHSIVMNRSTQYDKKASKTFSAMFGAIKGKTREFQSKSPKSFVCGKRNI